MSRVILITGANNGIGLATARSLLEMGDQVAALDLSLENLESHPRLMARICDVRDLAWVRSVVLEVVQAWAKIDVLINNACLALFKPLAERTPEELRCEFDVNYFGYLNLILAVVPVMREQRRGTIHNMSSGIAFTGMPGMMGYTSTKGAIEALTRTLSLELADEGIVVNVMHPPLTRTKSAAGFGIPADMMTDPARVGRQLARKVGSAQPYITPDFSTAMALFANRHFPVAMGRLLTSMSRRAKTGR